MAMAADAGHPSKAIGRRAALIVAALVLSGTAAWFAASWIDTGGDSTCGAVVHPDLWLSDNTSNRCQEVMAIRTTISAAILIGAVVLLVLAVRRRPTSLARAATILAISAAASVSLLVLNEVVRSDGAF